MSDEKHSLDSLWLSEDAAHRLLARAVELDSRQATDVALAQLREVATEAGIAPGAFELALRELREGTKANVPGEPAQRASASERPSFLHRLRRSLEGSDRVDAAEKTPAWRRAGTNLMALAAFWPGLSVANSAATGIMRWLGIHGWKLEHPVGIAVTVLGAGIAFRVRARLAAILLAVTAAGMFAMYSMRLIFGIQTMPGSDGEDLALILTGILCLGLGQIISGRSNRRQSGEQSPTRATGEPIAEAVLSEPVRERAPRSLLFRTA